MLALVGGVVGACAPTPRLDAQSPATLADSARWRVALERELAATHTPGAAMAVVVGDRVVYQTAVGVRDVETAAPMQPSTLVRVGSVTKMFTGLAAAILADQHRLTLDAPIRQFARGLAPVVGSRSLRTLLSHTAGLINEGAADGAHDDAALGARVRAWDARMIFAPMHDVYSYSSPGFWLAGYVIEQRVGRPYADAVQQLVLAPLQMSRSTFRPTVAMTYPLAQDHQVRGDTARIVRPYPDDVSTWPSGSLFTSATELAHVAIALLNDGRIDGRQALPVSAVRTVLRPVARAAGSDCSYAFGLSRCARGSLSSIGHYGFRGGSGAVFTMLPDVRVAVIILANRGGGIFADTEQAVLSSLAPASADSVAGRADEAVQETPASRRAVTGRYVSGADTLELRTEHDALWYHYGGSRQAARLAGPDRVLVLDSAGAIAQEFRVVRGARTRERYLHDGLNAYRRIGSLRVMRPR